MMANPEHVEIVKKSAKAIRYWQAKNPNGFIDLSWADLSGACLGGAELSGANLSGACLGGAELSGAYLSGAYLSGAELSGADLSDADLSDADLNEAKCSHTAFIDVNLSETRGLDTISHWGPSAVNNGTLAQSKGKIPLDFLRQCGFQPWEVESAKLYDPDLKATEISEILNQVHQLRAVKPINIGGIFVSYSHKDKEFVDKINKRLKDRGVAVWRDVHDLVAGPIKQQILDSIRVQDVVLIVLSKASIESDWVRYEIKKAHEREKKEKRTLLCPIALDKSWEKMDDPLWDQVREKFAVPFYKWRIEAFEESFNRLIEGLYKYYFMKNIPGVSPGDLL
jgi:TIR domain/Pentapeptide repeats (8 copies)